MWQLPSGAALAKPSILFRLLSSSCNNSPCTLTVVIPTYDSTASPLGYNTAVKQTIFAVEDDSDIARLVRHHLEASGYGVRTFATTNGVIAEAEKQVPALFLLDIMVPGGDGLELCRRIRQTPSLAMTPVIFLTAKVSESDRVIGLELGADDYIAKPFSPRELVARVRAVLRRFERPLAPAIVKAGDIEIDSGGMTLTVRGQLTQTTATEFRLLEYLARHPGRVFTRDQLLDAVWRDTHYVTPRSVDVYVRRIREKIEENPDEPRYLKTVRGAGYRFEIPKS
jgi:DNA-binding response OmpR family regulator